MGNSLRLCCNISYIVFCVSRFVLAGTKNENEMRKFLEKQNIKRAYFLLFICSLNFCIFLLFENHINRIFEEFDNSFVNNAYDVRYYGNFHILIDTNRFILPPGFYIKREIFKWLNIVNNILNNVLFLFISVIVDVCMKRYSNKVIKEKRALNCPHIADAIQYKTKLNK